MLTYTGDISSLSVAIFLSGALGCMCALVVASIWRFLVDELARYMRRRRNEVAFKKRIAHYRSIGMGALADKLEEHYFFRRGIERV